MSFEELSSSFYHDHGMGQGSMKAKESAGHSRAWSTAIIVGHPTSDSLLVMDELVRGNWYSCEVAASTRVDPVTAEGTEAKIN